MSSRAMVGTRPRPETIVPSFEQVYDAHFDFVWRVLRYLGVPESALDDAAQDVFVVVHRRLAEFEGRSSVRTWLYGIARRVAADHRARARRGAPPAEGLAPATALRPDDAAAAGEALVALARFLDTLDEGQREVFVLVEIEQLAAPAIAEALGVKLNTVYSRLRLARERFEAFVKRRQEGEP